jgi:peptidoglycan L-alanyl-D-glutamate endopeptidase CwlK
MTIPTNAFRFSQISLQRLAGVDVKLQLLATETIGITPIDFAVTEGLRTEERQAQLYREGKSKCDGINNLSKHQTGRAIDICPSIGGRLDYSSGVDLYFLVGLFYAKARELGIGIRTGALWDGNSIKNNEFRDGYHIELL